MNTRHVWTTTATIYDPERRQFWEDALGSNMVPITDLRPVKVTVPEIGETLAYMLDLDALWPDQKLKVIEGLARRFDLPVHEVAADIDKGVPIPVGGVYVYSIDGARLAALQDDLEDGLDDKDSGAELGDDDPDW